MNTEYKMNAMFSTSLFFHHNYLCNNIWWLLENDFIVLNTFLSSV